RGDSFEENELSWSQPERSFGADPGLLAPPDPSNSVWNQSSLASTYSAIPNNVSGGILAPFERPTDWRDQAFSRQMPAASSSAQPSYFDSVSPRWQGSSAPLGRAEPAFGFRPAGTTPEAYLNPAYNSYDTPPAPARQMQSGAIRLAGATRAL